MHHCDFFKFKALYDLFYVFLSILVTLERYHPPQSNILGKLIQGDTL